MKPGTLLRRLTECQQEAMWGDDLKRHGVDAETRQYIEKLFETETRVFKSENADKLLREADDDEHDAYELEPTEDGARILVSVYYSNEELAAMLDKPNPMYFVPGSRR